MKKTAILAALAAFSLSSQATPIVSGFATLDQDNWQFTLEAEVFADAPMQGAHFFANGVHFTDLGFNGQSSPFWDTLQRGLIPADSTFEPWFFSPGPHDITVQVKINGQLYGPVDLGTVVFSQPTGDRPLAPTPDAGSTATLLAIAFGVIKRFV